MINTKSDKVTINTKIYIKTLRELEPCNAFELGLLNGADIGDAIENHLNSCYDRDLDNPNSWINRISPSVGFLKSAAKIDAAMDEKEEEREDAEEKEQKKSFIEEKELREKFKNRIKKL